MQEKLTLSNIFSSCSYPTVYPATLLKTHPHIIVPTTRLAYHVAPRPHKTESIFVTGHSVIAPLNTGSTINQLCPGCWTKVSYLSFSLWTPAVRYRLRCLFSIFPTHKLCNPLGINVVGDTLQGLTSERVAAGCSSVAAKPGAMNTHRLISRAEGARFFV